MYMVVLITCPGMSDGERIAKALLKDKLAACVNVLPDVLSFFRWSGKIKESEEALLVVKTKKAALRKLVKKVKDMHQYENPEIIALPIVGGSKYYTKWIEEETI